jgi:hypothetical protein
MKSSKLAAATLCQNHLDVFKEERRAVAVDPFIGPICKECREEIAGAEALERDFFSGNDPHENRRDQS